MDTSLSRRDVIASGIASVAAAAAVAEPAVATPGSSDHFGPRRRPFPVAGHELHDAGPGKKWDIGGNALRFRGNSIVAQIPQDSAFFEAEKAAIAELRRSEFELQYSVLPHNSMHMTVFDCFTQNSLGTPRWPAWLSEFTTIPPASRKVAERLSTAKLDVPRQVTMRVTGLKDLTVAFGVNLTGADAATEAALRRLRTQLRDLLDVQTPNFDTYEFHSTLGYRLVKPHRHELRAQDRLRMRLERLFVGEASTVTIEPIAFTLFDDMLAFPQLLVL